MSKAGSGAEAESGTSPSAGGAAPIAGMPSGEVGGGSQNAGAGGLEGSDGGSTMMAAGGAADMGEPGGASGAPAEPPCITPLYSQLGYDDFGSNLGGQLFTDPIASCLVTTTHGSTCTVTRDLAVGKTCPGSLRLSTEFRGYASSNAPNEKTFGQVDFAMTDWTRAAALHVKVKVQPSDAPITGLKLFLISGADYVYTSIFDDHRFKGGDWYDFVFPFADTPLDLSAVRRLGVEAVLDRTQPADPGQAVRRVDVWLDDLWLEPSPPAEEPSSPASR